MKTDGPLHRKTGCTVCVDRLDHIGEDELQAQLRRGGDLRGRPEGEGGERG